MLSRTAFLVMVVASLWACGGTDVEGTPLMAGKEEKGEGRGSASTPTTNDASQGTPNTPAPPATTATNPGPKAFTCEGRTGVIGDRELTVTFDGHHRQVLLHVPKSYDPTKGTMLITGFHGYNGSPEQLRDQSNFNAESEDRNFIVAYVKGAGLEALGFNGGDCCGTTAWVDGTDDVGLAREVVKVLSAEYCVDPDRVYSAGFSNGGFMSYRLACELSDVYAAVASVSGVLGISPKDCKPTRPVPLIEIHGTSDPTVPYNGGGAAGFLGIVGLNYRSVNETISVFQKLDACDPTPRSLPIQGQEQGDTSCQLWAACSANAAIELCTVDGGGHQWPGGNVSVSFGGKVSGFPATKTILDFFAAHPMK